MKWPKIKIRREAVERALIISSAALVLLLSLKRTSTNNEPYEEPLNEIPEVSVSTTQTEDTRQTVVYYEDGDGYLVPVQRDVARQDGIAKATLELMVQNPRNDMDAARLGLVPIVPEGTTFDLDISAGHAREISKSKVVYFSRTRPRRHERTGVKRRG